jgi:hypothetical protein
MWPADRHHRARAEHEMNEKRDTDERLWHPWLRINRVLRVMLRTRWSAERGLKSGASSGRRSRCGSEIQRAGDSQRCSQE